MRRLSSKMPIRLTALLCALLLCAALCAPSVAAAPLAEGKAGALRWTLHNGTLSIQGQGAIPDYSEHDPAPWDDHRDSILRLELSSGITAVGAMAFHDCTVLTMVYLPNTVTTVGEAAFAGCESLTTVHLSKVSVLKDYAFSRCFSLRNVTLPDTLTTIGGYAFYRCSSLNYISIPASVTTIGSSAFAYCSALLRVDVAAPLSALPEWCFYGCERLQTLTVPASVTAAGDSAFTRCNALNTVYHAGNDDQRRQFTEAVTDSLSDFTISHVAPPSDTPPAVTDKEVVVEGDTMHEITTEIKQEGDTVIRVEQTVKTPVSDGNATEKPTGFDSAIHATLDDDKGWDDLMAEIGDQINDKTSFESDYGEQGPVRAEITLPTDVPLSGEWLEGLAGRDVAVTITSPEGSRFTIQGKDIAGYSFEKNYSLHYTLTPCDNLSEEEKRIVGPAVCYWLSFRSAFAFPMTVEVLLDPYAVHQNATVYEKVPDVVLQKLQTARVDTRGYAAFRLAVINTTTNYLVAMNVADIPTGEIVAPKEDDKVVEFGPLSDRYTITDIRGFLGLTMSEFTTLVLVVGGIFVGIVLLIVVIIMVMGKRKAKIAAIRAEVFGNEVPAPKQGIDILKELKEKFKRKKK